MPRSGVGLGPEGSSRRAIIARFGLFLTLCRGS